MGEIKEPLPVKLIVSAFAGGEALLTEARARLVAEFGPIDYESALLPFDHTDYYTPEFGPGLVRRIWAFEELIEQGKLADQKSRPPHLHRRRHLRRGDPALPRWHLPLLAVDLSRLCQPDLPRDFQPDPGTLYRANESKAVNDQIPMSQ